VHKVERVEMALDACAPAGTGGGHLREEQIVGRHRRVAFRRASGANELVSFLVQNPGPRAGPEGRDPTDSPAPTRLIFA
jgi:hypothetical protein